MYDNNISTHYPCCRLGIGPDRSGLRCASIPRVARPVLERGTPGDATCVQTPPPTHAPVRAATGTPPGAACAAATDSPRRSAVVVGRGPGHLCPAPLYGPAPGRPYRAQAPHRRHRPARLARRPGTTPSPWGSMRERHPCCAKARLRSQGSSTAACPPRQLACQQAASPTTRGFVTRLHGGPPVVTGQCWRLSPPLMRFPSLLGGVPITTFWALCAPHFRRIIRTASGRQEQGFRSGGTRHMARPPMLVVLQKR
jgi:hypothetical protein